MRSSAADHFWWDVHLLVRSSSTARWYAVMADSPKWSSHPKFHRSGPSLRSTSSVADKIHPLCLFRGDRCLPLVLLSRAAPARLRSTKALLSGTYYYYWTTNTAVVIDVFDWTQAPHNWSWCRVGREIAANSGNETWIKDISVLVWMATKYCASTVSILHSERFC